MIAALLIAFSFLSTFFVVCLGLAAALGDRQLDGEER